MESLLQAVGDHFAISGPAALLAAFAWGALSVVLSPCHLSSVPLVVAYLAAGGDVPPPRRAFGIASVFAGGILASIAAVGAATAAAGRIAGDVGRTGNWLLAALFVVFGLSLLGVLPLPDVLAPRNTGTRRGLVGALVLGTVFGVALGPCTFAFMAPLLGLALRLAHDDAAQAVGLVALYGLGHAGVIALAGTFAGGAQRVLSWSGSSRAPAVLRGVAGAAVVLAGLYLLYVAG